MKAIMISLRPQDCINIANDGQVVVSTKTIPKLDVPFTCYIYCKKDSKNGEILLIGNNKEVSFGDYRNVDNVNWFDGNDKVIGSFECNRITSYKNISGNIIKYFWLISDLNIYDRPKEINFYKKDCPSENQAKGWCHLCKYFDESEGYPKCGAYLKKPFKSWGYVEKVEGPKTKYDKIVEDMAKLKNPKYVGIDFFRDKFITVSIRNNSNITENKIEVFSISEKVWELRIGGIAIIFDDYMVLEAVK